MKLIYLASPYSHPELEVKAKRFEQVCVVAFNLIESTDNVYFCPIAMSHAIEREAEHALPHEKWMQQDLEIISRCDELWVVCIDGWHKSKGVLEEIAFARDKKLIINFISGPGLKELLDE